MSMNLYFLTRTKRPRYVEFPFQTPTDWTYEIYKENSREKRCELLRAKMKDNPWLDEDLVQQCEEMLLDSELELTYL